MQCRLDLVFSGALALTRVVGDATIRHPFCIRLSGERSCSPQRPRELAVLMQVVKLKQIRKVLQRCADDPVIARSGSVRPHERRLPPPHHPRRPKTCTAVLIPSSTGLNGFATLQRALGHKELLLAMQA